MNKEERIIWSLILLSNKTLHLQHYKKQFQEKKYVLHIVGYLPLRVSRIIRMAFIIAGK